MDWQTCLCLVVAAAITCSTTPVGHELHIINDDDDNGALVQSAPDFESGAAEDDPTYNSSILTGPEKVSCQFAHQQCTFRSGCGSTLLSYNFECHDLVKNRSAGGRCPEKCRNTLVGLVSTVEGRLLMECDCAGDADCEGTRGRLEACGKHAVRLAARNDTVSSCGEAKWICLSDAECGKALEHYHHNCGAMFRGRRCTERCRNSIAILRRQAKAAKLDRCECRGEDQRFGEFDCTDVKKNMARLCDSAEDKTAQSPHPPPMIYDGTNAIEEEEVEPSASTIFGVDRGQIFFYAVAVAVINMLCCDVTN